MLDYSYGLASTPRIDMEVGLFVTPTMYRVLTDHALAGPYACIVLS